MLTIHNILHPASFSSHSTSALDESLRWAQSEHSRLHILHVVEAFGAPATELISDEATLRASTLVDPAMVEELQRMVALMSSRTLDWSLVIIRAANIPGAIMRHAQENAIDLIIMGTDGSHEPGVPFLGSVAAEVMQRASRPVMFVQRRVTPPSPELHLQRLLVHVNFWQQTDLLMDTAAELAARHGAVVDLVGVTEPCEDNGDTQADARRRDRAESACRERLLRLWMAMPSVRSLNAGQPLEVSCVAGSGYPPDVVIRRATEWPADLVLLAAPGLHGSEYASSERAAEVIVRRAPCAVLTVNPTGRPMTSFRPQSGAQQRTAQGEAPTVRA